MRGWVEVIVGAGTACAEPGRIVGAALLGGARRAGSRDGERVACRYRVP